MEIFKKSKKVHSSHLLVHFLIWFLHLADRWNPLKQHPFKKSWIGSFSEGKFGGPNV